MNTKTKPHAVLMQNTRVLVNAFSASKADSKPRKKFGPTLSFNEVVKKYALNASKLRNVMRAVDSGAPQAVLSFANKGAGQNTYYDRAAITKWVEQNLEKLK